MRNRALTGPWAGFSFQGGKLITPEGHALEPQDLAWLSLTANIAQEWRLMMAEARSAIPGKACRTRVSKSTFAAAKVIYLRDELRARRKAKERGQQDMAAASSGHRKGSSLQPAPKRSQRV